MPDQPPSPDFSNQQSAISNQPLPQPSTFNLQPSTGPSPFAFRLSPFLLAALVFLVHARTPVATISDSRWTIPTALSILREGNSDLNEYRTEVERDEYYAAMRIGDRIYERYPIGVPLLILPHIAIADRFYQAAGLGDLASYLTREKQGLLEVYSASSLVGLTVFVFALGLIALTGHLWLSIGLTLVLGFGTGIWSTASRALWQHTGSILALTLAWYLAVLARKRPDLAPLIALPLAFSFIVRPTNAVVILAFTIYVFVEHRQAFIRYVTLGGLVGLAFVLYSLAIFGTPLPPYYVGGDQVALRQLPEALLGHLISPSRGLLVFSPVLILALVGLVRVFRGTDRLMLTVAASLVLYWVVISLHPHWWGGHTVGPRYFTDVLPFLVILLIPALTSRRLVATATVLGILGIVIQLHLVTERSVLSWNYIPENVDTRPERVWDPRDSQLLRGTALGR